MMHLSRYRWLPAACCAMALVVTSPTAAQDAQVRKGFTIEIVDPPNQSIVIGKTPIVAQVKLDDPELVDRVEFIIDDETIFVDREAPYECFYDFGEDNRSWIVRAVAYHKENVSVSDAVITRRMAFSAYAQVNRVLLWLSATDNREMFVEDLTGDDVKILENDQEQEILEFYREDRPMTLAILIDSSGSMQDKLKEVHKAASSFVDTLNPNDQALVIDFDDKVFLIQELTSDQQALKEAITSTEALGATALFDVLHAAYRKIGKIEGRKAIVLLSDGEDTASQFSYKRVLEEAKANNTMIYAIGLGGGSGGGPRKSVLKEFAELTGGRYFFVKKAEDLAQAYQQIAFELRAQYFLAYSTSNEEWDGRWMKIRVEPERAGIDIRARRGYFAVRRSN